MPLPEELRKGLDSTVADIANVAGERFGGMLVAGLFLQGICSGRRALGTCGHRRPCLP